MKIALTGGIACGKSLAASFMSRQGIATCEADELAHRVMEPGTAVYDALVDRFGMGIVTATGQVDRAGLSERVFRSAEDLAALNALVHPAVEVAWKDWLGRQTGPAALVVPLLFEAGYDRGWDVVICVCASRAVRRERLRERGMTDEQAAARMRAQWSNREKAARSDYMLWNDGTAACLEAQVEQVLESIGRQA